MSRKLSKKDAKYAKELGKHAGKWVAVVDRKVVASGKDLGKVIERAEKKGFSEPRVFCVPKPGTGRIFLSKRSIEVIKIAQGLSKCFGKWLALDDQDIIASGDSLRKVKKEAARKGINNPKMCCTTGLRLRYF